MQQADIYRYTLKYALAIAGSEQALAFRLRVSVAVLQVWLQGTEAIPTSVFLDAVDVIVSATPADIVRTRAFMQGAEHPNQ